ncbi:hypothetical protein MTR_5g065660 [Medicago truncatula]|uniref:DUF4283 domain protein n=1 Tax=Medicago truncatula TaxID=3880 RepID=G7KBG7_MEDTR|nr:hypothetical protein MTR_5g065660 [Medicago truncatula]
MIGLKRITLSSSFSIVKKTIEEEYCFKSCNIVQQNTTHAGYVKDWLRKIAGRFRSWNMIVEMHSDSARRRLLKLEDLRAKLNTIYKPLSKWGIVSLGRCFYEFVFSSIEDVQRVRAVLSWTLKPDFLKLFARSHDFNLKNHKQTTVSPITLDDATSKCPLERSFGDFARVLIGIDLSAKIRHKLWVEREGSVYNTKLKTIVDGEVVSNDTLHLDDMGAQGNKNLSVSTEERSKKAIQEVFGSNSSDSAKSGQQREHFLICV